MTLQTGCSLPAGCLVLADNLQYRGLPRNHWLTPWSEILVLLILQREFERYTAYEYNLQILFLKRDFPIYSKTTLWIFFFVSYNLNSIIVLQNGKSRGLLCLGDGVLGLNSGFTVCSNLCTEKASLISKRLLSFM